MLLYLFIYSFLFSLHCTAFSTYIFNYLGSLPSFFFVCHPTMFSCVSVFLLTNFSAVSHCSFCCLNSRGLIALLYCYPSTPAKFEGACLETGRRKRGALPRRRVGWPGEVVRLRGSGE